MEHQALREVVLGAEDHPAHTGVHEPIPAQHSCCITQGRVLLCGCKPGCTLCSLPLPLVKNLAAHACVRGLQCWNVKGSRSEFLRRLHTA